MKKLKLLIIIFLMLSLTGCMQKYKLTEQQSDETAEYMAGLLLKYDKDYDKQLLPMDQKGTEDSKNAENNEAVVTDTPTPTPANEVPSGGQNAASAEKTSDGDKTANEYTLSEVIGKDHIEVEYTGYKFYSSYPENTTNAYFSLTPMEGNQLLVATFIIKNTSNKDITLNLDKSDVIYQLDVNVGTVYKPQLSLLVNDLQFIDMKIEAGKSKTALLIFEVSKNLDKSNINLIASKNDKTVIFEIK